MTQVTARDLTSFELFNGLPEAWLAGVAASARFVSYKAHANLLFPGDTMATVYLVKKGWVKVYRLSESGEESTLCILGPGHAALEEFLFLDHPSSVGLKVGNNTEVIAFPAATLHEMCRTHPQAGMNLVRATMALNQELMHLIEQVTLKPALERVAGFLLQVMLEQGRKPLTAFQIPYEKREAAQYLGLTPETFSRSLKALVEGGVRVKSRIVFLASEKLLCPYCDTHTARKCTRYGEDNYCRFTVKASKVASLVVMESAAMAAFAAVLVG